MKKIFSFSIVICLIISCSNVSEEKAQQGIQQGSAKSYTECYAYRSAKDTVLMKVSFANDSLQGKLHFNFFEKDQNTGTLNGYMHGDTLFADYRFMSEGVESVSEVIFLRKGTAFIQGYGDMEEINGKMIFKNRGKLQFENSYSLEKEVCEQRSEH